jgi:hypothetical protein
LLCVIVAVFGSASCRDNKPQKNPDSLATAPPTLPVTGLAGSTGWDSTAGRVVVLPASGEPSKAVIVLPGLSDSTLAATSQFELSGLDSIAVDLFSQQGLIGSSILRVASQRPDATGCVNWPSGNLTNAAGASWRVGLEKGRAAAVPLDSLAAMKPQDSARFVTDAMEAASSLGSTDSSAFRGLQYSVRRGYRIALSSSPVIVAEVVRKINEEANPREEHTLFLAEKQSGSGAYRVRFSKRSSGREEALETSDVLAALELKRTNAPAIVISFEYEDGGKIGLLEKFSDGSWKIRWRSAYTGC